MACASLKKTLLLPLLLITGCASTSTQPHISNANTYEITEYQAVGASSSCSDFSAKIDTLEAGRPSMTYKVFNAATILSPASWIVSTAMGTNEERWQMITGELDESLDREIDFLINNCGSNTAAGPS